jgi:membrane-associated phospholipid phosphatase
MREPHLAAGAAIVVCAALLFVVLASAVLHEGAASMLDRDVLAWLRDHAGPMLVRSMQLVSALHAPRAIVVMTVLVALVLAWRRDWADMITVLVVVFGGATLNHLLKHGLQRARPVFGEPAAGPTDFSFPSGHVANATLLYGVVAALLIWRFRARPIRLGAALGAALLVATVGFSRLVLGAHHPSDVLAAVLVGVAWLVLCLVVRERLGAVGSCREE